MGKARKPLGEQKGHLTVARQLEIQQAQDAVEVFGDDALGRMPEWLVDTVAQDEWKRVVGELRKVGVIGNLDIANIGGYCNAFSLYTKAVRYAAENWSEPIARSAVKEYANEMRRFAGLIGLTIDSRLKIGSMVTDKKNDMIADAFGDI